MRYGHGEIRTRQTAPFIAADAFALAAKAANMQFGYMFSGDPNVRPADADRLPDGASTIAALHDLGEAMGEDTSSEPDPGTDRALPNDGTVPAAYTYFGQFVDHDITLLDKAAGAVGNIAQPSFPPLLNLSAITNDRTPFLELDSVYGAPGLPGSPGNPVPPLDGARMVVEEVSNVTSQG